MRFEPLPGSKVVDYASYGFGTVVPRCAKTLDPQSTPTPVRNNTITLPVWEKSEYESFGASFSARERSFRLGLSPVNSVEQDQFAVEFTSPLAANGTTIAFSRTLQLCQ
ncbi:MAG: hypothetical protein HRT45_18035 [Bdellovibrionales bacterium]|nr:hypothetical protein [Bdellovibrionales bacterium]